MEEFIFFHDRILIILCFIITVVGLQFVDLNINSRVDYYKLDAQILEFLWTLIPALILILVGLPSLKMLYYIEDWFDPFLTLKVQGFQWYWAYDFILRDFLSLNKNTQSFERHLLNDLTENQYFRLLETDNKVILPYLEEVQVLITSADVLHSWAVPRLGVKADAVPGRLNRVRIFSYRPGLVFGQCSEICGANHRFIPINIEFINVAHLRKTIH